MKCENDGGGQYYFTMSKKTFWTILLILLVVVAIIVIVHKVKQKNQPEPQQEEIVVVPPQDEIPQDETAEVPSGPKWLELPGAEDFDAEYRVTHYAQMEGRRQRNYTILYDEDTYVSYWVAYPLCHSHLTSGREEVWAYDAVVPKASQTSVKAGYGASCPTTNYPKNFYARGHQIPNADRNAVPEMMAQTYYSTNMTPQIQNGFNGGIWAKLETAVREAVPYGDTLYVVTGASFRKVNENLAAKRIVNKNDGKSLPVPNYYWKVLLKVERSNGELSSASTLGFWLPHDDLKGHSYMEYAVSVDQIEQWTGFDFFVNLPDNLEVAAETNSKLSAFMN